MKKSIIALSVAALLALSACSTPVVASAPAPAPSSSSAAAQLPAENPAETPTEDPASSDEPLKFGEKSIYSDGLEIVFVPVGLKQASETAAGAEKTNGQMYLFKVTVKNGTAKIMDPGAMYVVATYGAEGLQSSRVFDSASGIGDSFAGKILPGKQQTVEMAFAVPKAELATFQLSATPGFDYDTAIFTGGLK